MGIKERKEKHKENLRQSILDAAKKLFLSEGYDATSIRKIAAEIEFSPTTIYLYYKDKAEIAHALHVEGFKLLAVQFGVLQHVKDSFERLKAMGEIYIRFALENSDFYELMFVLKEPIAHLKGSCVYENWEEGEKAFQALMMNIAACQEAGYFKNLDTTAVALIAWSTLHGICSLKLHGHLDHMSEHEPSLQQMDDMLGQSYETFMLMLERLK